MKSVRMIAVKRKEKGKFLFFFYSSKILLTFILIVAIFFPKSISAAPEQVEKDQMMTNTYSFVFLSGHHLSLLASGSQILWDFKDANSTNVTQSWISPSLALRYGFHFKLYDKFGAVVGTSMHVANHSHVIGEILTPGIEVGFPTVAGGLIYAVSQKIRVLTALEYGALWFPNMVMIDNSATSSKEAELAMAPDAVSLYGQVDVFYTRIHAFSLIFGSQKMWNPCLGNCSSSSYLNGRVKLSSESWFIQAGMTWHLGDEVEQRF